MTRRKGDRGIYPAGPGVWRVVVSTGVDPARSTEDQRHYRSVERRFNGTLSEARDFRAKLIVEARQGRYGGTEATVNELLDAWLRELARIERAPSTIASYRKISSAHIRPVLGTVKVRAVTVRMLADHLAALTETGLAPNSVRLVKASLSSAFSQAARWEWIDKDPTKLVQAPTLQNKRPVIPTVTEVAKLLEAAQRSSRPEVAVAIWLSATTGIRRGELCALRATDFAFDRARLQIERALSGETVWTTKNRRWREVALDLGTIEVVKAHLAAMRARAANAGTAFREDGYLFTDTAVGDRPWNPHIVTDSFRKLTADLDMRHITFHSLRKFMESRALDLGFSINEVAHRAGHDPAVLMRFYAGAIDESGQKLADAVGSLLSSPGAVAQSVRAADS